MEAQLSLEFNAPAPAVMTRKPSQNDKVLAVLKDYKRHTLAEIAAAIGIVSGNTTGVSARIRDLRKPEHGSHTIIGQPRSGTGDAKVYEYWLVK